MDRSKSFIAIPPGATIKEQISDRGINQKEFSARMDMSEKHISKLINGEVQLTVDVARRLEMVLGLPTQFWCNLEAVYRETIAKINDENSMDEDMEIVKKIPYNEMSKNGWIEETIKPQDRVIRLRQYFEIVKLSLLKESFLPHIATRKLSMTEKSDFALLAWAQRAKLEARYIKTKPINVNALMEYIPTIRAMTTEGPDVFCPELIKILSDCGIAMVFLPHIGGSFLHGATFLDGKKIVVGLTVRGKDADKFWFSLFHELAHIILGHIDKQDDITDVDETLADEFAKNTLIPQKAYDNFIANKEFSKTSMLEFARKEGIDVGILVGRLQKENHIQYNWHNDLKTKYELSA